MFSKAASHTGRDAATLTVTVPSKVVNNVQAGSIRCWNEFANSETFLHIYRMFGQVAIKGVTIGFSVSNVIPSSTAQVQNSSTSFIAAWDRDGVLATTLANAMNDVKQETYWTQVASMGTPYRYQIGNSSGRAMEFSCWGSNMTEKSQILSTDFIRENSNGETFTTVLDSKVQGWNPTLLYCFMPGYQASVTMDIKFHLLCRGPRSIPIDRTPVTPSDPPEPELIKEPMPSAFLLKRLAENGAFEYFIGNETEFSGWVREYAQDAADQKPIFSPVSIENYKNIHVEPGFVNGAVVVKDGWQKYAQMPILSSIQYALGDSQRVQFVDSGNGNYTIELQNQLGYGVRSYAEEVGQLVTSCLRVDGAKCYSESMGGIHAVGYMDLQGAAPDTEGAYNADESIIANGFVQVGDVTDQASLLQVNIADSGPQYVEQYQAPDPVLLPGQNDFEGTGLFQLTPGGDEVIIDPPILANLEGLRIQFNVECAGGIYGERGHQYTHLVGGQYTEAPLIQAHYHVDFPTEIMGNIEAQVSGRVVLDTETPFVLTADQTLGLTRISMVNGSVKIGCRYDENRCYLVSTRMVVGDLISIPVTASKVWKRIKGFFKKAWKAIKNIVPKVTRVVSPVLPPPYGTVVASIGTAVTGIDTVVNAVATCAAKSGEILGDTPTLADDDAFEVTPQYRLYPEASGGPVDVMQADDSAWISLPTVRVGITSTKETVFHARTRFMDNPALMRDLKNFYALAGSATAAEAKLGLQQRLKVVFDKKCTRAQAANFVSTIRVGAECAVNEGELPTPMTEEEMEAYMANLE